jgi:hypothetical protein
MAESQPFESGKRLEEAPRQPCEALGPLLEAVVRAASEVVDGIAQPPAESSRIDDGCAANPDSREVGGRIDLGADGIAVEPLHGSAESLEIRNVLAQAFDLIGSRRNPEGSVLFDVRVEFVCGVGIIPASAGLGVHLIHNHVDYRGFTSRR